MRLRPLVIVLAAWAAFQGLSIAAQTQGQMPAQAASHSLAQAGTQQADSLRPTYFAVLGEVAHPGTYEAPGTWTLAELIKRAGGVTQRANRTIRIFRGGVLTQQVFLGSGADPSLLPGDLAVVTADVSERQQIAALDPTKPSNQAATVFAVQVAFVNLIERPVVVKMALDHATLPRIVELLGQSADCAAKIRVFSPVGTIQSELEESDQTPRPLASGTVLVFPSSLVRVGSLPALPAPIAAVSAAPQPVPVSLPEFKAPESNQPNREAAVHALQHKVHLTIEDGEAPQPTTNVSGPSLEMTPSIGEDSGSRQITNGPKPAAIAMMRTTISGGRNPSDPHAGRTIAIMAAMSAVAGAAMLLTIISIVQRWLQSGKPPFQRFWNQSSKSTADASTAVIPIPPISTRSIARRPLRIDARQPITRLSVDLAAIERVTQTRSGR